ncbi:MAG: hypothetical protein QW184_01325 [Nanopusillaceae archaeon]
MNVIDFVIIINLLILAIKDLLKKEIELHYVYLIFGLVLAEFLLISQNILMFFLILIYNLVFSYFFSKHLAKGDITLISFLNFKFTNSLFGLFAFNIAIFLAMLILKIMKVSDVAFIPFILISYIFAIFSLTFTISL